MDRYISIDIETLGLDPDCCDMIEFAAVIDDLKSPIADLQRFHVYLLPPTRGIGKYWYQGDPSAMAMHADKLSRIANQEEGFEYIQPHVLGQRFMNWLGCRGYDVEKGHVKIDVAGKNFSGFDANFLNKWEQWRYHIRTHHRVIDPGSMYFDPRNDPRPPSLEDCLKRAGIEKTVTHSALDDAIDVIRVLRYKWGISCG
jgi:DNA polymerase III epsilon subunit-like protein